MPNLVNAIMSGSNCTPNSKVEQSLIRKAIVKSATSRERVATKLRGLLGQMLMSGVILTSAWNVMAAEIHIGYEQYVGLDRAQQGVDYYNGRYYTSSGNGKTGSSLVTVWDSNWNRLQGGYVGPPDTTYPYHIGDISVGNNGILYAPVRSTNILGVAREAIRQYSLDSAGLLQNYTDIDITFLDVRVGGVDYAETFLGSGVSFLWAVEFVTSGLAQILKFLPSDISNPIAGYDIPISHANGIEIIPGDSIDPYGRMLISHGNVNSDRLGMITEYEFSPFCLCPVGLGAGQTSTFPTTHLPLHAEGLTVENGNLWLAQGSYVLRASDEFRPPVPEPSTAILMGLGMIGLGAARRRN